MRKVGWTGESVVRGLLAAIGACILATVLAACGGAGGTSEARFVPGDGSVTMIPPADRQPAPDVTGETLDGKPFSLKEYQGKVVAMNVWASWCAPCRAEAPTLNQVSREYQDKGVQFIGLDTRDTKASAEAFIRRFEVPYPNVWDPDASIQLAFRDTLPPAAIPSTVFIDQQGRVAARVLGRAERAQLREILDKLLAEGQASASPAKPTVAASRSA